MKVVINKCFGGYSLSEEAYKFLNIPWDGYGFEFMDDDRSNPALVKCVEDLGEDASGSFAELKVVEIPDGVEWEIDEDDGMEWVVEKHHEWE